MVGGYCDDVVGKVGDVCVRMCGVCGCGWSGLVCK